MIFSMSATAQKAKQCSYDDSPVRWVTLISEKQQLIFEIIYNQRYLHLTIRWRFYKKHDCPRAPPIAKNLKLSKCYSTEIRLIQEYKNSSCFRFAMILTGQKQVGNYQACFDIFDKYLHNSAKNTICLYAFVFLVSLFGENDSV